MISDAWTATLTESVIGVATRMFEYIPTLVGSLILLLVGWIIARLLRALTYHVSSKAMRRLNRTRHVDLKLQQSDSYQSVPEISGRVIFWTVLLFFVAAAVEALGLPAVSSFLGAFTAYLPRILIAILIVFVGLWAGEFTRNYLARSMARTGLRQGPIVGRLAQAIIISMAVIVAVEQTGIDSTMLVITLAIGFFVTLGAAGLAFGLGARSTVANVIAAHYVKQNYSTGDKIRLGDSEGYITELTATSVVLDDDGTRVHVPAQRFSDEIALRLPGGD